MTRSRLTLLVAAILTTACGQLLDASPDGFSIGQPPNNFCTAGSGPITGGTSSGGYAGGGGLNSGGASAGSAGSISGGGAGMSGGSAGVNSSGSGGVSSSGSGGVSSGGAAGTSGGSGGAGGPGGGGTNGQSGESGSGGVGGSGSTGSPYETISSTELTAFADTGLVTQADMAVLYNRGVDSFELFSLTADQQQVQSALFTSGAVAAGGWSTVFLGKTVNSPPAVTYDSYGVRHVLTISDPGVTNFWLPPTKTTWQSAELSSSLLSALGPAAAPADSGRLHAFVVSDDSKKLLWATVNNKDQALWTDLGGPVKSAPAVVRDENGDLDVFVRWGDDRLAHRHYRRSSGWENWTFEWGGVVTSTPAVTSWGPGRLDIFTRDTNNHLQYRARYEDGQLAPDWTPYEGTTIVGAPAVMSWQVGSLRVLVRDAANRVLMASLQLP